MKRFFCTICGRIKRVRKYPTNIARPNAEQPEERIGTCSKHTDEPVTRIIRVSNELKTPVQTKRRA